MEILSEKRCTNCGEVKLLSNFGSMPKTKDGRSSWCKKCITLNTGKWSRAHPKKVVAFTKAWRKRNPDKVKAALKRQGSTWANNNRERSREIKRSWASRNLDAVRQNARNRHAREKAAVGTITKKEWLDLKDKYNHTCLRCGKKEPEIKLTLDHVRPIILGGTNTIDNAQPLCFSCNSSKNAKHIDYRNLTFNKKG